MSSQIVVQIRAAEAARRLLSLICSAEQVRSEGFCVGLLLPQDVVWLGTSIERGPTKYHSQKIRHWLAVRRHLRRGHDSGCRVFGVPLDTMRALLGHWAGFEAAEFLLDIVDTSIREIEAGEWGQYRPSVSLKYVFGRVLTVEDPAKHVEQR